MSDIRDEFLVYPPDIAMQLTHPSFISCMADDGTHLHHAEREEPWSVEEWRAKPETVWNLNYGSHPYELLSEPQRSFLIDLRKTSFRHAGKFVGIYLTDTRVVLALAEGIGVMTPHDADWRYEQLLKTKGEEIPYTEEQGEIYGYLDNRFFRSRMGMNDKGIKGPVILRHDLQESGLIDILYALALQSGIYHEPHP